jgi:hypothetical protein
LNIRIILLIAAIFVAASCKSSNESTTTATQSNLTAGMAKRTIVKGSTPQQTIMEIFGPPDLTTRTEAGEVWTYDKVRYDVESSSGYLTVLVAGAGGGHTQSSSTSTMLIIYFDSRDIVKDYRISTVRF